MKHVYSYHYAHWDIPNPIEAEGTEEEVLDMFRKARHQLDSQIKVWLSENHLPVA